MRVVSALALIPLAIGTAYLGGWPFAALWTVAALVVFREWTSLVTNSRQRVIAATGMAFLLIAGALAATGHVPAALLALAIGACAAAVLSTAGRRIWAAAGIPYSGLICISPVALRAEAEHGFAAMVFLFVIVWSTDTVAYFLGRAIGGAKLMPQVSPKKTWAGALSGTAAAILAGIVVAWTWSLDGLVAIALLAAFLSIFAQGGDLFESYLKRKFGAKDSGHVIPGHGGLMDRLDGFVAAGTIAALIGLARGGWETPARGLLVW